MSKNNQANHSSHLENHDLDNFSKTGYSNSRLGAHFVCKSHPKRKPTTNVVGFLFGFEFCEGWEPRTF